jgi:hypothetical protein
MGFACVGGPVVTLVGVCVQKKGLNWEPICCVQISSLVVHTVGYELSVAPDEDGE